MARVVTSAIVTLALIVWMSLCIVNCAGPDGPCKTSLDADQCGGP